jgi:hypothetical protein
LDSYDFTTAASTWGNSSSVTYRIVGGDYYTPTITLEDAPPRTKRPNQDWLDKRVNEMRVAL